MDYDLSDSSGTDDDLPPSHQNRFQRGGGRATGDGRSAIVGAAPLPRVHNEMEIQIHLIEQEAYCSVLRAFKAQSDAITWEKEGLITELRKELRVSDEEHRELLSRVNADDMIRRIREWRKAGGPGPGLLSKSKPVHDQAPSPTMSASRKKQKTTGTVASLPFPAFHPSMQPSSSALRCGPSSISKNKKQKSYPSAGASGRAHGAKRSSLGAFATNEPGEAANFDPLIGKKVWTRWPDDNNFYEAVITNYNPAKGLHALMYDINTENETWEWINLKEIPPEDIRWEGEDPGISHKGGRPGQGRGPKKPVVREGNVGGGLGMVRGTTKTHQPKKGFTPSQNGNTKKGLSDIVILHTDTLIRELEKVLSTSNSDPAEIEKAKRVLKEHEEALEDAIARLEDASDGESADGAGQRAWRKRPYEEVGERRVESSVGDKTARDI
ncbi:protein EMSY-LIKE 3-like isoform X2 [Punica granatum]|uniref:Protein EMSY-LIKE 3-like isoform X2 n=1 Tax=Punica granatum TaxID=22663 RepID=A0A6P8D6N8_PUNGR|nr:protein EMSY-LIKE 3-like isoform X2 [Punica granatum]